MGFVTTWSYCTWSARFLVLARTCSRRDKSCASKSLAGDKRAVEDESSFALNFLCSPIPEKEVCVFHRRDERGGKKGASKPPIRSRCRAPRAALAVLCVL